MTTIEHVQAEFATLKRLLGEQNLDRATIAKIAAEALPLLRETYDQLGRVIAEFEAVVNANGVPT